MRQATDGAGNYVESALDYPWGQVWVNNGNANDQNFAGMPDRALDLDMYLTGSRQLGMNLSRWLSPDEYTGGPVSPYGPPDPTPPGPLPYADITNPQSLNKYQYAYGNPLRYVDPTGHWGEEDHVTLSSEVMTEAGFSCADQRLVNEANVGMDKLSNQTKDNNYLHYMAGTEAAAEKFMTDRIDAAVAAEMKGDHKTAMTELGKGMHTAQDRYAHAEQNVGGLIKHELKDADNTKKHPTEFKAAKSATRLYLARYKAALQKAQQEAKKKEQEIKKKSGK